MIEHLIREAGAWAWFIFGLILMGAEVLVPGNFIVWLGVAAILNGLLSLALWEVSWWVWELQWLVFALLSVLSLVAGRRIIRKRERGNDEPLLNQRAQSMVGRTADLMDPIVNGFGRAKFGDTVWIVQGPDLPLGTRVKVVSSVGSELVVTSLNG